MYSIFFFNSGISLFNVSPNPLPCNNRIFYLFYRQHLFSIYQQYHETRYQHIYQCPWYHGAPAQPHQLIVAEARQRPPDKHEEEYHSHYFG
jgi:hypothetical protein